MTDVVLGEASESDEEYELIQKIFGVKFSGEATESDEDVFESKMSTRDALSIYRSNLLQRKLIETNIAIWKSLTVFVKNFVVCASKQLLNTDQLLIKTQVSMQSALSSLKLSQNNVKQLYKKTNVLKDFIPKINIKH